MVERIIKICMGSSCFSRGNKDNLEIIQAFIKNNSIEAEIHLTGNLCNGLCNKGPNLFIDDKLFSKVNKNDLKKILRDEILDIVNV